MIEALLERFPVSAAVAAAARRAAARTAEASRLREANARPIHAAVLAAFLSEGIAESDLAGSLGNHFIHGNLAGCA